MIHKIVVKMYTKRNKLGRFSKENFGTSCHRTSLTFYETTYTAELCQNVKIHEHSPKF